MIPKALGIIFLKHPLGQGFEKNMPEEIHLQEKVFCKLCTVHYNHNQFVAQCKVYKKKLFFVIDFSQACNFQIIDPGGVLER